MVRKLVIAAAVSAFTLQLQASPANLSQALRTYFDMRYADTKKGDAPGAAVIIARGDSVLFEYYTGLADMEKRIPIGPATTFNIASVSKQFTVAALLQLSSQGLVDIDRPLNRYFTFEAPFWGKVTPRHLASQSSGIADERDRSDRRATIYADDKASVSYFPDVKETQFEPGTAYDYVNPTFILLAQIVEKTSGQEFTDYQRQHIFTPAGMDSTYYFDPKSAPSYQSHAYRPADGGRWEEFDYGEETFFATRPDGGIYSTARDMARWEQALAGGVILPPEVLAEAYTPQVDVASSLWCDYQRRPHTWYALGWFVDNSLERPLKVYHTGDNGGYQAYVAKYPESLVRVIVLENRHDLDRWSMGIDIENMLMQSGVLPHECESK